jgi:curved DNA-binding protein CbpA
MRTSERDYYKVLQIDPEADPEVIDAAYQVLAARFHPESDLTGVHEIRLGELNRAHAVLSDPGRRRAYDIERSDRFGLPDEEAVPLSIEAPEMAGTHSARGLGARLNGGPAVNGGGPPLGGTVLDFGRYAGMTLREIAGEDVDYLRWLTRHSSGIRFRGEIQRMLREDL